MTDFCHLHVHSEFSLLDGLTRPSEIIEVAEENGQSHIAITDHGTLAGYYKFQEAAAKSSVTPVLGIEAYFVPELKSDDGDKKRERFHLILLAENDEGLRNLMHMNRVAWTDGYYYKPRIDFEMLEAYGSGLIALSGCMGGAVSQSIIHDDPDQADKLLDRFLNVFDNSNFFLELQPWLEPDQQKVNNKLIQYADSRNIPLVGTIDCHYPRKDDRDIEEMLLAIGTASGFSDSDVQYAKEHVDDANSKDDIFEKLNILWPNRHLSFEHLPLYVMPTNEVEERFREGVKDFRPEILENTKVIAERCTASMKKHGALLPSFTKSVGVKVSSNEYLREIANLRLQEMGLTSEKYRDTLDMELEIITDKNFSDYFLILWDICSWAKKQGIAMGPGRGSSGGSLLAYCLGITKVDPVRNNLLFWRFLNPERNDYPDIDMDFEDRRRDEVKDYCRQRWGADNVASIATYGTFQEKSAFKAVTKVLGASYKDTNNISARIKTVDQIAKLDDAVAKRFMLTYSDSIPISQRIQGTVQQAGAHAAGVVIAPYDLCDILPIEARKDEATGKVVLVTAFDKKEIEDLGLIKLDALSLNTLSVISDALRKIKEVHGIDVEDESLDVYNYDVDVIKYIGDGNTVGIFQSEGAAYTEILKELGAGSFYDLVVANGLIRPGAYKTQGKKFVDRKHGKAKVEFASPVLEPILSETYGTWIFEEQLMESLVHLCGFSWGKADRFRKIISKKLDASEFLPYKEDFMAGATQHISENVAQGLWDDILVACEYMFNKSHSFAYSMLTYQTAWLKYHYPTEFIWALLTNESNNSNITTYLFEAKKLGVEILTPDINLSEESFSLDGKSIRFGLGNVMKCGPTAVKEIINNRPYVEYDQFLASVQASKVKANTVENLDKVGAFDSIGHISQFDHKSYYAEVLNYPLFLEGNSEFDDILTSCIDVAENEDSEDLFIIRGVVKDTKRTDRYYRITLEDRSGSLSVFASQDVQLNKRDSIIAMVGDSGLHHIEQYSDAQSTPPKFVRFMNALKGNRINDQYAFLFDSDTGYELSKDKTVAYLLSVTPFKTKKGSMMANAYFWNPTEGFFKTVVFPRDYAFNKKTFDDTFGWYVVKASPAKGGGHALNDIIAPEKYCKLKKIPHTPNPLFSS